MICEACQKRIATIHFTQKIEGTMRTNDYCEECATRPGVVVPGGYSLTDILLGVRAGKAPKKDNSDMEEPPR